MACLPMTRLQPQSSVAIARLSFAASPTFTATARPTFSRYPYDVWRVDWYPWVTTKIDAVIKFTDTIFNKPFAAPRININGIANSQMHKWPRYIDLKWNTGITHLRIID